MSILDSGKILFSHPLTRHQPIATLSRVLRWQLATRIFPSSYMIPFVNASKLLVRRGMLGATGSVYFGLHEFSDMSFLLHLLRNTDVFYDVGANVGTYTILAASAVGARTVSFEPIPSTYSALVDNVRLNRVDELVRTLNVGVGSQSGEVKFSVEFDVMNHALASDDQTTQSISAPVVTIDELASHESPTAVKIDVEGYESEVILGSLKTLSNKAVKAILIELNGFGARYGFNEDEVHTTLLDHGFGAFVYEPFSRELNRISRPKAVGNTLYLRDLAEITERIRLADPFKVLGHEI